MDITTIKRDVYTVYKPLGKTPSEIIEIVRGQLELQSGPIRKICCSGRLDPMAHGTLLVLTNNECKNISYYNKKDKVYQFSFIVGISTDTTDVLGLVNTVEPVSKDIEKVVSTIKSFDNHSYEQEYHIFSSNPVIGPHGKKPLFYYARNQIDVLIPTKQIQIYNMNIDNMATINSNSLKEKIFSNLSMVSDNNKENFRYNETIEKWDTYFDNYKIDEYLMCTCTARVSSGTYIRQIVKDIGKKLQSDTLVIDLHRTELIF